MISTQLLLDFSVVAILVGAIGGALIGRYIKSRWMNSAENTPDEDPYREMKPEKV
jgi:hypothetical protein